jgi:hypothetical protein
MNYYIKDLETQRSFGWGDRNKMIEKSMMANLICGEEFIQRWNKRNPIY